jgi:hypothetical protein
MCCGLAANILQAGLIRHSDHRPYPLLSLFFFLDEAVKSKDYSDPFSSFGQGFIKNEIQIRRK